VSSRQNGDRAGELEQGAARWLPAAR